jgi:hypothetical protein
VIGGTGQSVVVLVPVDVGELSVTRFLSFDSFCTLYLFCVYVLSKLGKFYVSEIFFNYEQCHLFP